MLAGAPRREFDAVLVWAADRLARSVRHFLEVLDTRNHLGIEFVSFREQTQRARSAGRSLIVSAVAELERRPQAQLYIVDAVEAGSQLG